MKTYKRGDIFKKKLRSSAGEEEDYFILAMVNNLPPVFSLISLLDGNRWRGPYTVPDDNPLPILSEEQLIEMMGGEVERKRFTHIEGDKIKIEIIRDG